MFKHTEVVKLNIQSVCSNFYSVQLLFLRITISHHNIDMNSSLQLVIVGIYERVFCALHQLSALGSWSGGDSRLFALLI